MLLEKGAQQQLSANVMRDLFTARFSEQQSNARAAEEAIIMNWCEYLEDVECGSTFISSNHHYVITLTDSTEVEMNGLRMTLGGILAFATGFQSVPLLGFHLQPELTSIWLLTTSCGLQRFFH